MARIKEWTLAKKLLIIIPIAIFIIVIITFLIVNYLNNSNPKWVVENYFKAKDQEISSQGAELIEQTLTIDNNSVTGYVNTDYKKVTNVNIIIPNVYSGTTVYKSDDYVLKMTPASAKASEGVKYGHKVIYPDVWPGVDVLSYIKGGIVEQDLLVKNKSSQHTFTYNLDYDKSLVIKKDDDQISLTNKDGRTVFRFPKQYVYSKNSTDKNYNAVNFDIVSNQLTITLNETNLKYPVLVDPTLSGGKYKFDNQLDPLNNVGVSKAYDNFDIEIDPLSIVTMDGDHTFGNVEIMNQGILTHTAGTVDAQGVGIGLTLHVNSLTVDAWGDITADAKGYQPGTGSGAGQNPGDSSYGQNGVAGGKNVNGILAGTGGGAGGMGPYDSGFGPGGGGGYIGIGGGGDGFRSGGGGAGYGGNGGPGMMGDHFGGSLYNGYHWPEGNNGTTSWNLSSAMGINMALNYVHAQAVATGIAKSGYGGAGGSSTGSDMNRYNGFAGGGKIVIDSSSTVTVNGTVKANGASGPDGGGGGAGGSVTIKAAGNLSAGTNAVISANGGIGGNGHGSASFSTIISGSSWGGCGGGGLVQIYTANSATLVPLVGSKILVKGGAYTSTPPTQAIYAQSTDGLAVIGAGVPGYTITYPSDIYATPDQTWSPTTTGVEIPLTYTENELVDSVYLSTVGSRTTIFGINNGMWPFAYVDTSGTTILYNGFPSFHPIDSGGTIKVLFETTTNTPVYTYGPLAVGDYPFTLHSYYAANPTYNQDLNITLHVMQGVDTTAKKTLYPVSRQGSGSSTDCPAAATMNNQDITPLTNPNCFNPYSLKVGDIIEVNLNITATGNYTLRDDWFSSPGRQHICAPIQSSVDSNSPDFVPPSDWGTSSTPIVFSNENHSVSQIYYKCTVQ